MAELRVVTNISPRNLKFSIMEDFGGKDQPKSEGWTSRLVGSVDSLRDFDPWPYETPPSTVCNHWWDWSGDIHMTDSALEALAIEPCCSKCQAFGTLMILNKAEYERLKRCEAAPR